MMYKIFWQRLVKKSASSTFSHTAKLIFTCFMLSVTATELGVNAKEKCNYEDYVLGKHAQQDDPCLLAAFKQNFLLPPPSEDGQPSKHLPIRNELPANKQKFKFITKLLIENSLTKTGFFIECGANDGDFISSTIKLERTYNWTGLLIEAEPKPFKKLLAKKRNAWAVNVAACVTPYPQQITFYTNPKATGLSSLRSKPEWGVTHNMTVKCIPLYTMIKALNVTSVDYLNLDVEGSELAILETLPWDKVSFKVMTVEHAWIPGGKIALTKFLESRGYRFVTELSDAYTKDSLYVHETLFVNAINIEI